MTTPHASNRTRSEAIAASRIDPDTPVAVAGRWVTQPSGKEAFKVGVGLDIQTVEPRFAYRDAVIPKHQLIAMQGRINDYIEECHLQAAAEIHAENAWLRHAESSGRCECGGQQSHDGFGCLCGGS